MRINDRNPQAGIVEGIGWLDVRPGWRVLDAGCGDGDAADTLAAAVGPTGRITFMDRDVATLGDLRGKIERAGLDETMTTVAGDLHALPFDDASFDAVWMSAVTHHLERPDVALGEVVRVVRPGGRIGILDGDLDISFPGLAIDPDIERALRRASWRAADDRYGGTLEYFYEPSIGRRLPRLLQDAGTIDIAVHAVPELVQAPLSAPQRQEREAWLTQWFDGRLAAYIDADLRTHLHDLFGPTARANPLDDPGFFMLRTWLVCTATVAGDHPSAP